MRYALGKLGTFLVTMFLVSALTFVAFAVIPGDPATAKLGTEATPEQLEALRQEMGLNEPLPVRYLKWVAGFFSGDLGTSYKYSTPVGELLGPKLRVTLALSLMSFFLIVVIALPVGLFAAGVENKTVLGIGSAVNQLLMAVPPFFTGIILTWVFSLTLHLFIHGDFPSMDSNLPGALHYLFYAAVAIAIPRIAMTVRMMKSTADGEEKKDYVRTVYSKGASKSLVMAGHILKNAVPPIVSFLAQTLAEIIAASIVVEQVFAIPGLGRFLVSSISGRDYPVVEAIVVIIAFWVVLAGTLADLINLAIDPRLRKGDKR